MPSIDWTKSMSQTFEFCTVDPGTWCDMKKLDTVTSATISRDVDSETLGSASFDLVDVLGECYIRTYLIATQNGYSERIPLGTHLLQTPSSKFNGKNRSVSVDAYTPLLELKEKIPPLGYSMLKGTKIFEMGSKLTAENARAPVVGIRTDDKLEEDFVANTNDTWLTFLKDLLAKINYSYELDEMGRILFTPVEKAAQLQPVYTFYDNEISILQSDISINHDIYGLPNVVEVVYSKDNVNYYSRVVNDSIGSPISTVNRGREIVYRVTDPDMNGLPTQEMIDEYAKRILKEKSTVTYSLSYTHSYCPVRIGDCVRINYEKAGLKDIKAKVISQTIKCSTGCQVSEKAEYTVEL